VARAVNKYFLGVDPSSSKVGLVVVDLGGIIVKSETWDVRGHSGKWDNELIPVALHKYAVELNSFLSGITIRCAGVEQLSVTHNMDTVRKIAYFEAISLATLAGRVKNTTAKKKVLGKGNLNKEKAREALEHIHGRTFEPDEADALLFAEYARRTYMTGSPVAP
jgi:Holliday junction resolvasome RuvABC endonuclease subunit